MGGLVVLGEKFELRTLNRTARYSMRLLATSRLGQSFARPVLVGQASFPALGAIRFPLKNLPISRFAFISAAPH